MKDISGQRFGRLVALQPTEERKHGACVWLCQCDCGNTARVNSATLRAGRVRSCGCLRKETAAENAAARNRDLTGQRFGRLVVMHRTEVRKNGFVVWACQCDCGNTIQTTTGKLTCGETQSCGCLQKEMIRNTGQQRKKDITGQKFGLLTAVRPTEMRKGTHVIWECRCDCGCTTFASQGHLASGSKKSCGCLRYRRKRDYPTEKEV